MKWMPAYTRDIPASSAASPPNVFDRSVIHLIHDAPVERGPEGVSGVASPVTFTPPARS